MHEDAENGSARIPGLVIQLYNDYQSIRQRLEDCQTDLSRAREREVEAARAKKDAGRDYEDEKAAMLAIDTRASGKNDAERKRNADALITSERQGGKLKRSWDAFYASEKALDNATLEKKIASDELVTARYIAHMIAGLGRAIGG